MKHIVAVLRKTESDFVVSVLKKLYDRFVNGLSVAGNLPLANQIAVYCGVRKAVAFGNFRTRAGHTQFKRKIQLLAVNDCIIGIVLRAVAAPNVVARDEGQQ